MMDALPHWQQILSNRGILGAAQSVEWCPEGAGWAYPVWDVDGTPLSDVGRLKAFDSSARPKYRWLGEGERPHYWLLPGTREAITAAYGCVILASGEPDVLTYRSAGAKNVLCWFGE